MAHPMRRMAVGGVGLGVVLLTFGILILLARVYGFPLDVWTVCSFGLIVIGVVVIVGVIWARSMMRGGWRSWMQGWDEGWRREPPMQP